MTFQSCSVGGEFIINGAERVVVSQLAPKLLESTSCGKRTRLPIGSLPSCRVIPERGSWIEVNATKKDRLTVRIDQSGKFSALTLLRAMDPKYGEDSAIIQAFYDTAKVKGRGSSERRQAGGQGCGR